MRVRTITNALLVGTLLFGASTILLLFRLRQNEERFDGIVSKDTGPPESKVEYAREGPVVRSLSAHIVHDSEKNLSSNDSNAGQQSQGNGFQPDAGLPHPPKDPNSCNGSNPDFPNCKAKMEWMAGFWETNDCYRQKGVDGTLCSFQQYLSEVEHWCPVLPWRQHLVQKTEIEAQIEYNIEPLLFKLSATSKFEWIMQRLNNFWPKWVSAVRSLEQRRTFSHHRKRVLLHLGVLTDKAGFRFAENAFSGAPLGELVQWSDLIATLHLLGHDLEFSTELHHLKEKLVVSSGIGGCPTASEVKFDAIFIDIAGLRQFKSVVKGRLQHYQCLFRVLDSFGTEPTYNFKRWKPSPRKGDHGQSWGNWELQLRQFMTLFPHTPDNSFLGFVVDADIQKGQTFDKRNQAVVYGKELYMWQGKRDYLDVISKHFEVHATVAGTEREPGEGHNVPGFVVNHGILNSTSLKELLQTSRVFIGLGFPYEGPAPLEAIAYGCVFINPQLDPPVNRDNSQHFAKKPTGRTLISQHPYAHEHISSPHVYTINMNDLQQVERIAKEIVDKEPPSPYLPYEFTMQGMLERIMVYMEHQDFCNPKQWPPLSELKVIVSKPGKDCKETCSGKGLVCEPEFFPSINNEEAIARAGLKCTKTYTEHSVHGPSVSHRGDCSFQEEKLLMGCVGAEELITRICPCRTYRPGQIALCESCI